MMRNKRILRRGGRDKKKSNEQKDENAFAMRKYDHLTPPRGILK
jgi:hypothetical protein